MPHGPGEGAPLPVRQRGRKKPKQHIKVIKPSAAPKHPSTVIHRATGGKHVSPVVKQNIKHANVATKFPKAPKAKTPKLPKGYTVKPIGALGSVTKAAHTVSKDSGLSKVNKFLTGPSVGRHTVGPNIAGQLSTQQKVDAGLLAVPLPEGVVAKVGELAAKASPKAVDVVKATEEAGTTASKIKAGDSAAVKVAKAAEKASKTRVAKLKSAAETAKIAAKNPRYAANAIPLAAKGKILAAAGTGALGSEPIVAQLAGGVDSTQRALRDNPGKTLATTVRVAEGVPAALVGLGADAAQGHLGGFINQQKQYIKQVSTFVGGGAKGQKVAENKLGLIPDVTAALGAYGLGKGVHGLRSPKEGRVSRAVAKVDERPVKRLIKKSKSTDDRTAEQAVAKLETSGTRERLRKRPGRNRHTAQRVAESEQGRHAKAHYEEKAKGRRRPSTFGRKESYGELLGRLDKKDIGDTKVALGDTINLLTRTGWRHNTRDLRGKMVRYLESLHEPNKPIRESAMHTARVVRALADHPEVLKNKDLQAALDAHHEITTGQMVESHVLDTGRPQETVNPKYLRSQHLSQMRAEGVLTAEDRHAPELRHIPNLPRERPGLHSDKAVRGQANNMLNDAKRKEAKAEGAKRAGNKDLAEELNIEAAHLRAAAQERLDVVDRFKRADALDHEAAAIEAGKAKGDAAAKRREARALREQGVASQEQRLNESLAAIHEIQQRDNLAAPAFTRQTDLAAERGAGGTEIYPSQRAVTRTKFKSGSLEAQGRINESTAATLASVHSTRLSLALQDLEANLVREEPFVHQGMRFFTKAELDTMRRQGLLPRDYNTDVRVQRFSGTIHRDANLLKEYQAARQRADVGHLRGQARRDLYVVFPRTTITQFEEQLKPIQGALKGARVITKAQSGLMLGTSLTWAEFQVPASPLAVLASNWSPARYARVARAYADIYRKASTADKAAFDGMMGTNVGNFLQIGEAHLMPDTGRALSAAYKMADRSELGRLAQSIWENIKHGGPITAAVRTWELRVRRFAALMELDRKTGLTFHGNPTAVARMGKFVASTSRVWGQIGELQKAYEGMTPHERLHYQLHDHPLMRDVIQGTYDMLGDYGSLTKAERTVAAVTLFYPFVRYSLRFLLWALPKNHPIKAAILYNLAQSNDIALQKKLGGTPSLLQDFGIVVTHNAQGGINTTGINLARAAPGGNAVIEALGSGKIDLSTVMRPLNPLIGGTLLALAGQTGFGTSTSVPAGDLVARNLLNLSPLTRPLAAKVGPPPTFTSQLFRAINSTPTNIAGTEASQFTVDLNRKADSVKAEKLLKIAYGPIQSFDDVRKLPVGQQAAGERKLKARKKAWTQLDALARKYGVTSPAEEKQALRSYKRRSQHATDKYGIFGTGAPQSSGYGGSNYGSSSYGSSSSYK